MPSYEDAAKMKRMIYIQFALISILAMSDATGTPDLLPEPDDDDNDVESEIAEGLPRA